MLLNYFKFVEYIYSRFKIKIMAKLNENYLKLQAGYLFPEIERRVSEYSKANPQKKIIKMGIGDVSLPLVPGVIKGFQEGVDEMSKIKTFRGYGPYEGYRFLREAIVKNDYNSRGVQIDIDEIFISDGSKSDTGNIQEIFSIDKQCVPASLVTALL